MLPPAANVGPRRRNATRLRGVLSSTLFFTPRKPYSPADQVALHQAAPAKRRRFQTVPSASEGRREVLGVTRVTLVPRAEYPCAASFPPLFLLSPPTRSKMDGIPPQAVYSQPPPSDDLDTRPEPSRRRTTAGGSVGESGDGLILFDSGEEEEEEDVKPHETRKTGKKASHFADKSCG